MHTFEKQADFNLDVAPIYILPTELLNKSEFNQKVIEVLGGVDQIEADSNKVAFFICKESAIRFRELKKNYPEFGEIEVGSISYNEVGIEGYNLMVINILSKIIEVNSQLPIDEQRIKLIKLQQSLKELLLGLA